MRTWSPITAPATATAWRAASPSRTCAKVRSKSTWFTPSPPRRPTTPVVTRARSRTSTASPPSASPPTWMPSAASAATGPPLVQGDEVLTILPGTLGVDELKRRLADTDAAVVLKLGRSYPAVREALSSTGRLDEAFYV